MVLAWLLACGSTAAPPGEAPVPAPAVHAPAVPVAAAFLDGRLRGICDGSAAVRLEGGRLLVAYDEDASLYGFDGQGNPTKAVAIGPLVGAPEGEELDLEAAAVDARSDGALVWWIGSHGSKKDGSPAPTRQKLFATNLPNTDLSDLAVVRPPVDLLPVLTAFPAVAERLAGADRAAKEGGLNVEALAVHPQGGLLVGLRSPLSEPGGERGTALLVHVREAGGTWTAVGAHPVDLGNRGFRDLVPRGDGWLVAAGPVGGEDDFALFAMDAAFAVTPFGDPAWAKDLRPEAIVPDGSGWLLLSDDGKVDRPDATAKKGVRGCDQIRADRPADPQVYLRVRRIPEA